ncbi:OmpA family protein [Palleronia sediminis]|uniref:OmpA family protein n=1 Tax=Palleronia sediminis TaxID=2547833 RepID=A0A4R6A2H8_9RHOB|nr:OmpA family protein [Palleronia sediminis]TDL75216.1 OmpA family protein [Palleronia sediminis]
MKHKRSWLPVAITFTVAASAAAGAATVAVTQIETRSVAAVREALSQAEIVWAAVEANGLQLAMTGTAPDEAARFRALSAAGSVVDGTRVIDGMDVRQRTPITAPHFSVEVLRTGDSVTLIGLVPASTDREELVATIAERTDSEVADLLEAADFEAPETWGAALDYGIDALEDLEKAKISISAETVSITTLSTDAGTIDRVRRDLARRVPEGVALSLDISAPRPVISPFVLRLVRNAETTRFDACAAGTEDGAERILEAAREIGLTGPDRCKVGLGVPTPDWPRVAAAGIAALGKLDGGTLTLSDLEMRLEGSAETPPETFSQAAATLRRALPAEVSLTAVQADTEALADGPVEFVTTRSPEGVVQLRGPAGTQLGATAIESFARARFGLSEMDASIEIIADAPEGWAPRVLASLDALSVLDSGAAVVRAESIRISGVSGQMDASAEITRLISERLGDKAGFEIDVSYDERLDPRRGMPTPQECVAQINRVLAARQITFDPGSAIIDAASRDSMDAIAEIIRTCPDVPMEVAGFTDSQGREEMNRELSQSRADAVIEALLNRRVLTDALVASGYGEENPIADNDTPEGREANRRIEFTLLTDEAKTEAADDDTPEGDAAETETDADQADDE